MTNQVVGPVVEGKKAGSTELHYLPFSNDGSADPVIATEKHVADAIGAIPKAGGLKVYTSFGGELYDDAKLPDVLIIDGTKDFDITATLALTSANYRRFWFVNMSQNHEAHVSTEKGSYSVAGPMSTALILANKDGWQVLSVSPYVPPTFLHS